MRGLRLFLLLVPGFLGAAQAQWEGAGKSAYAAATIPQGVRATGMGEAYTAVGDNGASLRWNPAGLARLRGYELSLAHNEWAPGLAWRQETLTWAQRLNPGVGLGVGLDYLSLGKLERRAADGALSGQSEASAMNLDLGSGFMLGKSGLALGAGLAMLTQTLYDKTQYAWAASLGLLYEPRPQLLLGLSLQRLGLAYEGAAPSRLASLGLAAPVPGTPLLLAADASQDSGGRLRFKAGMEAVLNLLVLRAGWRQGLGADDAASDTGPTAGLGIHAGRFSLDYAFTPRSGLDSSHRVEITASLPPDFFSPRVLSAESSTVTARALYSQGLDQEGAGESLKALILYQRATEAYPEAMRAAPQDFYTDAGLRALALQARLNKSGDRRQIDKLAKEALNKSLAASAEGRFGEALEVLNQALKIDPENQELVQAAAAARQTLDLRLAGTREAARAKASDLATATELWRKVLRMDPQDMEAQEYLTSHRGAVRDLVQDLDRKAIYLYVGGKVAEAEAMWSRCEALDHFGDVDFRRNLERARRQLGRKN